MTVLELEELVKAECAKRARARPTVVARYPRNQTYAALIESEFAAAREQSVDVRRASDIASITLARDGRASLTGLMSALMGDPGWSAAFNADVERRFQAKRRQRPLDGHAAKIRAAWRAATGERIAVLGQVIQRLAGGPQPER